MKNHQTEKTITFETDTCIPMFIAALFTIARTWKQPRYPSTVKKDFKATLKNGTGWGTHVYP